jgi:hypothetical protein
MMCNSYFTFGVLDIWLVAHEVEGLTIIEMIVGEEFRHASRVHALTATVVVITLVVR